MEAFHTVLGDFANGNMQPRTAQMLVMEGAYRFSIDRDRELDYQLGADSLDVGHYRSWLRLEANTLAEAAGFEKPYPNEPELGEDSGERFCHDYWLEQRKREQKYEYTSSMKYCPCERCVARRKTCKCAACTAWRARCCRRQLLHRAQHRWAERQWALLDGRAQHRLERRPRRAAAARCIPHRHSAPRPRCGGRGRCRV